MWVLVVPSWFLALVRGSALALRSCATNPQFIWVAAHCWGGLVGAHNLYPSSHQPPICLVAAKLSNMFFIVLSRLSPLIWPRNWFLLMRGDPESRIHILLSHLMLALYNVHVPQSKEDIILEAEKIFGQTNIQFPLRQLYLEFLICSDMDFPLTASRFLTGSNLSL